ncbi:MAG: outer membrane lipoprotein-sorting protein [Kiritimatiellaeota bacterium]|nr:outer membrane lipoprotein-sorting protein [Kiritimatiellota bacterium]
MKLPSLQLFQGLENSAPFIPSLGKPLAALMLASACIAAEPAAVTNAPIVTAEPPAAMVDTLPDAAELLKQVVAGLPAEPLAIQARAEGFDDLDFLDKVRLAEMHMEWKGGTIRADYTICDAFGANLAKLDVNRPANGEITYKLSRGAKLEPAVLTLLDSPLEGTDINWLDLTLSYLWWTGGRTVGTEHVKGRLCYIVDLPVPRDVSALCSTVRLWIEAKVHVLMQAEAFDAKQQRLRAPRIKSFKKVKDFWMIEDLEVQSYPSRHRTLLRVQEVRRSGELLTGAGDPMPALEPLEPLPPTAPVRR